MHQKKDLLVFKNLVKAAVLSLEQKYSIRDIQPLVSLLELMENDVELWNHSLEGLVIFATLSEMIIYRIEKEVEPISIVSNTFHIKPLVQYFQATESFSILALEADSFALYVGNYHGVEPMVLKDEVQTTLSEVLGTQHTANYQPHGIYGGTSDEVKIDREKFFRYVDRFVLEEISKKYKLPLILVANKEHHFDFKNISINPFLLEVSIEGAFSRFQENDLNHKIREINDGRFNLVVTQVIENYQNLRQKDMSSDQLIIVMKALLEARVDVLMIEANKLIPGRINIEKQQIIVSDIEDPQTDDLLDDMVQHALKTGSKVYVLDAEKMPTTSGVAATFRY
jgi:hypothetical protein